jgi:hypothetical protein
MASSGLRKFFKEHGYGKCSDCDQTKKLYHLIADPKKTLYCRFHIIEQVEEMMIGYLDLLEGPIDNPVQALMKRFGILEEHAQNLTTRWRSHR